MIQYAPESPQRAKLNERKLNMATRKGKHRSGNVRMGVYVEPIRKAIAVYLANKLDMTMTDVIWLGIENLAKAHGILTIEGKVSAKYKAEISAAVEIVKQSEVKG